MCLYMCVCVYISIYIFTCIYKNKVEQPHRSGFVEQNSAKGLTMCWPAPSAETACGSNPCLSRSSDCVGVVFSDRHLVVTLPCFSVHISTTCTWPKPRCSFLVQSLLLNSWCKQSSLRQTNCIVTQKCTLRCLTSLLLGCFNLNFSSWMWSILISRLAALFILLNVAFPLRAFTGCSAQGTCMFCLLSLGCCSSVWLVCGVVCVSSFILLVKKNQL